MKFTTRLEKAAKEQGRKWEWVRAKIGITRATLKAKRENDSFTEDEQLTLKRELKFV